MQGDKNNENWKVYVNGEMVPWNEAKISVFDRGFQYGDGVFEGMRCYDGRIFKLQEHTDRLFRSAKAVHIEIPLSKQDFNRAVKSVVRENDFREAHLKPQVTRGTAPKLGLDPRNTTAPNIVIPARPIGKSMFDAEKGFRLAAVSVRKIPAMCLDPRIKSLNYLVNILARAEALASGADEAIMLDIHGYVAEGPGRSGRNHPPDRDRDGGAGKHPRPANQADPLRFLYCRRGLCHRFRSRDHRGHGDRQESDFGRYDGRYDQEYRPALPGGGEEGRACV